MEDTKMMLESQKKDMEKKIKILEAGQMQCKKDLSAAVRACRTAENEREKLALELSNAASKGSLALEEKTRLDARWGQELSLIFFLNNT